MDDPGQFAKLEPVIAGFEARQFFDDLVGYLLAPAWTDELYMIGKEAAGALVSEPPRQLAHGFRVCVGLHGSLSSGPVVKEDEWANHLIAPLDVIDKVQLELGKIPQRFHQCVSLRPPWRPSGRLVPTRCDLEALLEEVQAGRWESL